MSAELLEPGEGDVISINGDVPEDVVEPTIIDSQNSAPDNTADRMRPVPGFFRLVPVFDGNNRLSGFNREQIYVPHKPRVEPVEVFSSE